MRLSKKFLFVRLLYISLWAFLLSGSSLWAKDFVVVIDPGHGGRDPGAVGKISKEKDINLKVALKVGDLIKKNCKDVKVIYTRSTDVFVALDRRAQIANNAKADLFISIHTDAASGSKTVKGVSTWTLGLARSDANLEVAKRENSVILYESDYQTRYAGFNPNSAESYIIFEFMQDKYMEQSVHLASLMQKEFKTTCKRIDRGVHQAGFLVLKASAMPSILIELGFISTPEEERYLNSEQGMNNLANGIYRGFLQYKKEQELRLTGVSQIVIPPAASEPVSAAPPQTAATASQNISSHSDEEIVFKVQILSANRLLPANDKSFKGLKGIDYYKEGSTYKYTYGASTDYNQVQQTRRSISAQFKDAFVIAFRGDTKMDVKEAIEIFKKQNK
ncbi:MAG: N-acetylmuramoyl-L-alanine amidase, partial [Bacteroides sp.]|nr:N-acetylmuramoyl-L-alanine amidase [Bacteroides sp.]